MALIRAKMADVALIRAKTSLRKPISRKKKQELDLRLSVQSILQRKKQKPLP